MSMLTVGSTFSGVGGADIGLERAGFRIAWQCESDPWKRSVLQAHWPDIPVFHDVRDVAIQNTRDGRVPRADGTSEPDQSERGGIGRDEALAGGGIDLLIGGFPCQDLSVAGKRRGFDGERSVLAFEFLRIAESIRPRWILLENVPGLLSSNGGRDMARLVDEVGTIGYGWAYRILDARYFGVPQRRRRVFICARRADAEFDTRAASELALRALWEGSGGDSAKGWPEGTDAAASVGSSVESGGGIAGSLTKRYGKGINTTCDDGAMIVTAFGHTQGIDIQPSTAATPTLRQCDGGAIAIVNALDRQAGGPDDNSAQAGHIIPQIASTLTRGGHPNSNAPGRRKEDDVNLVGAPMSVRRLTPIECERLMGWPDNWTAPDGVKASDSKRYAACGDGIVSHVAYWIGCRIKMIEEES